ncbi:MAG: bifunctional precorrin-2 dehydrogenase/sirohydrochlorin ferrochelatase [Proteobacteria bacterium]|nr:bifunctional precorrin-2 dehydrogenase/sirohydrochlorin ferrochelatase [Pseudomonadota bacterium]
MRYYPVFLDVMGKHCLVIGGGKVGTRKAKMLFRCGAIVTAVSPVFSETLTTFAEQHPLILKKKEYDRSDIEAAFIVVATTDDKALNLRIKNDAETLNILCNISDQPEESDFLVPSVVSRGDLSIAISTNGKSPALAKKLRQDLEKEFGSEYAEFLSLMGNLREKLLHESHDPDTHRTIFEDLIQKGLLDLIRKGNTAKVDSLLYEATGKAYRMSDLIFDSQSKS